jgi:hypothetical protein
MEELEALLAGDLDRLEAELAGHLDPTTLAPSIAASVGLGPPWVASGGRALSGTFKRPLGA